MSISFIIALIVIAICSILYVYSIRAANDDTDGALVEELKKIDSKTRPQRMLTSAISGMIRGILAGLILTGDFYHAYLSGIAFAAINPVMLYLEEGGFSYASTPLNPPKAISSENKS